MSSLLVKNIHTLITMDNEQREIRHGALLIRDNVVEQVGTTQDLPGTADQILDLEDHYLVLPGLINTHHHFFQILTRAVPEAQNSTLFGWLQALYSPWSKLTCIIHERIKKKLESLMQWQTYRFESYNSLCSLSITNS